MARRQVLEDGKIGFRAQFFNAYTNKLLTITTGMIVIIFGFLANFQSRNAKWLVVVSLALLGISVLSQLLVLFVNYLGMGVEYDGIDEELSKFFGQVISVLILTSLVLVLAGVVSGYVYILYNV